MSDRWPFAEPHNQLAFAVRRILDAKSPIRSVLHDGDGDWQFLDGEPVDASDAAIVCLACMIDSDPALAELHDLPQGWEAWRDDPGHPWQREQRDEEDEEEDE